MYIILYVYMCTNLFSCCGNVHEANKDCSLIGLISIGSKKSFKMFTKLIVTEVFLIKQVITSKLSVRSITMNIYYPMTLQQVIYWLYKKLMVKSFVQYGIKIIFMIGILGLFFFLPL